MVAQPAKTRYPLYGTWWPIARARYRNYVVCWASWIHHILFRGVRQTISPLHFIEAKSSQTYLRSGADKRGLLGRHQSFRGSKCFHFRPWRWRQNVPLRLYMITCRSKTVIFNGTNPGFILMHAWGAYVRQCPHFRFQKFEILDPMSFNKERYHFCHDPYVEQISHGNAIR